jgi:hypothetical protein
MDQVEGGQGRRRYLVDFAPILLGVYSAAEMCLTPVRQPNSRIVLTMPLQHVALVRGNAKKLTTNFRVSFDVMEVDAFP